MMDVRRAKPKAKANKNNNTTKALNNVRMRIVQALQLLLLHVLSKQVIHGLSSSIPRSTTTTTMTRTFVSYDRHRHRLLSSPLLLSSSLLSSSLSSSTSSSSNENGDELSPSSSSSTGQDDGSDDSSTDSMSDTTNPNDDSLTRKVLDWIQHEQLASIVSKEEAITLCYELINDDELMDTFEAAVVRNWDASLRKLRTQETANQRSVADVLGDDTTTRIIAQLETINLYSDVTSIQTFLESPAVQELFSTVLYDGIYEFFQTMDVVGNIIAKLPVLGPIRNKIRDDIKTNLDRTLGPLVRTFLQSYTKIATNNALSFIITNNNNSNNNNNNKFNQANGRIVKSLLNRPTTDLLQILDTNTNPSITELRIEAFKYLRQLKTNEGATTTTTIIDEYINIVYDLLGAKSIESIGIDINKVYDASPTLETTTERLLQNILALSND